MVMASSGDAFNMGEEWKVTEDAFSMAIFGAFGEATRARAAARANASG